MSRTVGVGPWCGTPNGYTNHSCRCDQCRAAWANDRRQYNARWMAKKRKLLKGSPAR